MDRIDESIAAIEKYKPSSNVYLRVVGEGENQRLEAVTKCWLGRILMWLGLTSACMTKVANFIACNIEGLCKTWFDNAQKISKNQNCLGELVSRVSRYDAKHPKNITSQTNHIVRIYAEWMSTLNKPASKPVLSVVTDEEPDTALPTPASQTKSAPGSPVNGSPVPVPGSPDSEPDSPLPTVFTKPGMGAVALTRPGTQGSVISNSGTNGLSSLSKLGTQGSVGSSGTLGSTISHGSINNQPPFNDNDFEDDVTEDDTQKILPPASGPAPLPPMSSSVSVLPAMQPARPSIPIVPVVMPIGSGLNRFNELWKDIHTLYNEESGNTTNLDEYDRALLGGKALTCIKGLLILLKEAASNPDELKEILKSIIIICTPLLKYAFKGSKYFNASTEDLDVFGINRPGSDSVLSAVVEHAPQKFLRILINMINLYVPTNKFSVVLNFAEHIENYREIEKEKEKLYEWIIRSEIYKEAIDLGRQPTTDIEKQLSDTYLTTLLRKPKKFTDPNKLLDEYVDKFLFTPTMNTTSRLQNSIFTMSLSWDEQLLIGKAIFKNKKFTPADIQNCAIIKQLIQSNPELGQRFYDCSMGINTNFPFGFHKELRELNPGIERERIKYILTDKKLSTASRHEAMANFIICTYANAVPTVAPQSILDDPTECAKLTEDEITLIGAAMFTYMPPKNNWKSLYFINSFLESDPKLAAERIFKIYKKAKEMDPKFEKYSIFLFYYDHKRNYALLDAIEKKVGHARKYRDYLMDTLKQW